MPDYGIKEADHWTNRGLALKYKSSTLNASLNGFVGLSLRTFGIKLLRQLI